MVFLYPPSVRKMKTNKISSGGIGEKGKNSLKSD
jgi:hypothetical protein